MKTSNNTQRKVSVTNHRSYFDWGSNMQVIREGNGDIAMTESELARFFGVTWRKLNGRLQAIAHNPNLYPDEKRTTKRLCTALSTSNHHCPILSVGQYGGSSVQKLYLP